MEQMRKSADSFTSLLRRNDRSPKDRRELYLAEKREKWAVRREMASGEGS